MRFRIVAAASLAVLLFGALAFAQPIEVDFSFVANQSEAVAWQELAEIFNSKQDRIRVSANWDPTWWTAFEERTLVRIAGGNTPDIIRLSDESFPEWARAGLLLPLTDRLERDINRDEFLPVTFSMGTVDGVFYGFPQGIATRALAYNRSMFAEAGLPFPGDDWRWDIELLEAARRLTTVDSAGEPLTYGIGFWFGDAGVLRKDIPEIIWSFGGEIFDAEGNFRLRDEGSIAALEFLVSLVAEHGVYPADFDILGRFVNGRLGMWNTGVWDVAFLRQQTGLDWDFAPTPGGPAGHYSFVQGNGLYVIPKDSPKADAAWEFMKFLVSEEAQEIFALKYGIGGVPLRTSLVPYYVMQPSPPDSWEAFVTSVNRGRQVYQPRKASAVFNALNDGWGEMVRGQLAVRTWLDRVTPVVESILAESE